MPLQLREDRVPPLFDIESIGMKFPTAYLESMNTVLVQECLRYNRIIDIMRKTLPELQKALKGLVVLSADLEETGDAIFTQKVPSSWAARAYPSLKPLAAWVDEDADVMGNLFGGKKKKKAPAKSAPKSEAPKAEPGFKWPWE